MTASLIAQLRTDIAALPPVDTRHATSTTTFLDALERLPRPFDEQADPVHVTASAIVVGSRGTVLHRHRRLGLWLQPGGHLDPGELPWVAARRETAEETGLVTAHPDGGPRLVHVDVHPGGRGHTHLDLRYLLHAPDDDPMPAVGESPDVAWFDWEAAISRADAGLVGALRAVAEEFRTR